MILQQGCVFADTTLKEQLEKTTSSSLSVTVDQTTALQMQTTYQVSSMVTQIDIITLRLVIATRLHEEVVEVTHSPEEAYLGATGRQVIKI